MNERILKVGVLLVVITLLSCSTNAGILTKTGEIYDGRILSSDAQTVVMEIDGVETEVAREGIEAVDHPGTFHMLVGGVTAIAGAFLTLWGISLAVSEEDSFSTGFAPYLIGSGLTAVIGGTWMEVWGFNARDDSTGAYNYPKSSEDPGFAIAPFVDGEKIGAGVSVRF